MFRPPSARFLQRACDLAKDRSIRDASDKTLALNGVSGASFPDIDSHGKSPYVVDCLQLFHIIPSDAEVRDPANLTPGYILSLEIGMIDGCRYRIHHRNSTILRQSSTSPNSTIELVFQVKNPVLHSRLQC